jgi:glycosyltransferase involved in cell wall biosynthesis
MIIDKICIKYSDYVWFMNNRQFEIRKERGYFDKMANNFCVVPSGVDEASIFSYPLKDIDVFSLVLLGVIGKAQGIDLVVESMPDIIENIPDFKLKIIGSGPYEKELKDKVKVMGLEGNVVFYGFVTSEEETRNIIGRSGAGVALYVPDPYACTRYADSGKAKVYLSCGVPVIITNVPYTALEIDQFKAGVMINYTRKEFVRAVFEILNQGTETLFEFKSNAVRLAKQYSTKVLMSNVFLENKNN